MKYFIYKSNFGDIRVAYSEKGITAVALPYDSIDNFVGLEYEEQEELRAYFNDYFDGQEFKLPPLDIKITAFQKKVFDLLCDTKRGTVLTYGDIAKLIHCGSNQAIGQALKRNPAPLVIPCHRVVGKGWEGGFGGDVTGVKMDFKRILLKFENSDQF